MAIKLWSLSHDGVGGAVKALQANIRACKQQSTQLQESNEMVSHLVNQLERQPEYIVPTFFMSSAVSGKI